MIFKIYLKLDAFPEIVCIFLFKKRPISEEINILLFEKD